MFVPLRIMAIRDFKLVGTEFSWHFEVKLSEKLNWSSKPNMSLRTIEAAFASIAMSSIKSLFTNASFKALT